MADVSGEPLKPCPFCGGEGSIIRGLDYLRVYCVDCEATTPSMVLANEAIGRWNRRAAVAAPTVEGHEDKAQGVLRAMENLIAHVLTLPADQRGNVFAQRDALKRNVRDLLSEAYMRGRDVERKVLADRLRDLLD